MIRGSKVTLSNTASALRVRHPFARKLVASAGRYVAGRAKWRRLFDRESVLIAG
jgi:hypothetical protein